MLVLDIWDWFVLQALAALMLGIIGIAGRHVIVAGNARHSVLQVGATVGVIVAVASGSALVVMQIGPIRM
jgi:hypothetical protein